MSKISRAKDPSVKRPPASGRTASRRLTGRDVVTSAEELVTYHQQFQSVFQRREQQRWSLFYLCGQLSNLERKTIEPMVLELLGTDPNAVRALQHYIGQGTWDATAAIRRCQQLVAHGLGEVDGVVIVDGSGFPKQGAASAGVARQYCGALGKVANCQEGVFVVYVSRRGYTFVDGRLYIPDVWFEDAHQQWRHTCGLPEKLSFHTEPELALEMIHDLVTRDELPFRWVTADEHFGQNPGFLEGVSALGKWYLVEVPVDTRVWLRTPRVEPAGCGPLGRPRTHARVARTASPPQAVRDVSAQLSAAEWTRYTIKEGAKGHLVAEFAFLRVTPVRAGLPGARVWLICRRSLTHPAEVKTYLSNAPTTCPREEFVRVSGLRWPIETALEEGKGEVGMDQYETRTWVGWHHHMAHTFMAHLFLTHLRLLFEKRILRSPLHKRTSWWPTRLTRTPCQWTSRTSSPTGNIAIMPLTARTLSAPPLAIVQVAESAKSRSNAKSRCSTRKTSITTSAAPLVTTPQPSAMLAPVALPSPTQDSAATEVVIKSTLSAQATSDAAAKMRANAEAKATESAQVTQQALETASKQATRVASPGYIPSIDGVAGDLQFYEFGENGPTPPELSARKYQRTFSQAQARFIYWDVQIDYPPGSQSKDFTFTYVYDGAKFVYGPASYATFTSPDTTSAHYSNGFGQPDAGKWPIGTYTVQIFVDKQMIASGSFSITE